MSRGEWTPQRIGHVLQDCADYLTTLYARHKIKPKDRGLDPDKLVAASRASADLSDLPRQLAEALAERDQLKIGNRVLDGLLAEKCAALIEARDALAWMVAAEAHQRGKAEAAERASTRRRDTLAAAQELAP